MECSPVSLTAQAVATGAHHLLVDGEGILGITLETLFVPVETPEGHVLPPNSRAWTSTASCALIQPFHSSACKKLTEGPPDASAVPLYAFDQLADGTLSWLMGHPVHLTRGSICGYRLCVSRDVYIDSLARGIPRLDQQTLLIYDFAPMRIKKARHAKAYGKTPLCFSKSLNILDLDTGGSSGVTGTSSPVQSRFDRILVTKSGPATEGSVFQHEPPHYATESPYILLTRRIRMSPYQVCQVTQQHMLLSQVSRTIASLDSKT